MADLKGAHRAHLLKLREDAEAIVGTARKIVSTIDEVLAKGGMAHIQPQMAFLTGALARMTKDWGVVEHQQQQGATQRGPKTNGIER